jgi:hypothetical protein
LLIAHPEAKIVVDADFVEFIDMLDKELSLLDAMRGSELTKQIADADQLVDRYVVGINRVVESTAYHFDPLIVEAGDSINKRLKSFGRIEIKPYEEGAAAVKALIHELRNEYAAKAELIGLTPWVDKLEAAEAEFDALFKIRNTQRAGTADGMNIKSINKQLIPVYRRMIMRLNAALVTNETAALVEFANELNKQIDYANEHGNHSAAKISIENIIVKTIEPQLETGSPITYMPELFIEDEDKQTKLVFSVDYTLTYKNNIKAGVAEIIVSGKGKFKGKKSVTFMIIRI